MSGNLPLQKNNQQPQSIDQLNLWLYPNPNPNPNPKPNPNHHKKLELRRFQALCLAFLFTIVFLGASLSFSVYANPQMANDPGAHTLPDTTLTDEGLEAYKEEKTQEVAKELREISRQRFSLYTANPVNGSGLSNEYLDCQVHPTTGRFTIGTSGGNPDTPTDDNQKLLYGHPSPWSSYTTIHINNKSTIYGDTGFSSPPSMKGDSNSSTCIFDGVEVTQELRLVRNVATQKADIVQIQYKVKNTTQATQAIGLRIMLDTMLGSNDDAPFRVPQVGEVTTEHEFTGANIPPSFQAFDSLSSPKVVSYGSLLAGSIHPNKVQFTNWSKVYGQSWGYQIRPGKDNGDSAVSVIWERTLAPGQEETYETRYGLSALVQDLRPPLETTISGDAEVSLDAATQEYVPYPLTIDIQNVGNASAKNVVVDISLPEELQVKAGQPLKVTFPEIKPQEIKKIDLLLEVRERQKESKDVEVTVGVHADNVDAKRLSKKITIPANRKAIIILPGMACSLLNENDNGKPGIQIWLPNFPRTFETIWKLTCTDDGSPLFEAIPEHSILENEGNRQILPINNDRDKYGLFNNYSQLVNSLFRTFNKDYDVLFFSYDWRLSNTQSAAELEAFINRSGYVSVNLVAHSMGGLLALEYLRRNPDNQKKVDTMITLGTPFLGAPKTLYFFELASQTEDELKSIDKYIEFLMGKLLNEYIDIDFLRYIPKTIYNFSSLYELLPSKSYFDLNNTSYVTRVTKHKRWSAKHDERERLSYVSTYNLLSSRIWAKTEEGKVKPMLSTAVSFHSNLASPNPIINKVNYYAVLGYGKDTIMEIEEKFNNGKYIGFNDIKVRNAGDGTVPLISANIGGLVDPQRDFYVKKQHSKMLKDKNVIQFVINLLQGDLTHASSIHDDPPGPINAKGWIPTTEPTIKLRVACPVTLSLLDEKGIPWAEASSEAIMNHEPDQGSFYTLGEDNEIKIAFLHQNENHILLTGTDSGVMTYTASVLESGYETKRVIFRNVPLTKTTKIYTDTNFQQGLSLELDEDGDGKIDRVIEPTASYEGKDLEEEIDIDPEAMSNYGLISKSEGISMNLAAKQMTIDSNLYSTGILSLTGKDIKKPDIIHAKSMYQNGINQPNQEIPLEENLEEDLKAYVEESLPVANIPAGRVIGKTTYVKGDHLTIDHSFKVKDHLRYNTTDFTSDKPTILASEKGDISIIARDNFDFTGIIYAPNGTVTITGKDIKLNGVILANRIYITGENAMIENFLHLDKLE